MILEGIVTSLDQHGKLNVAPMGPIVDETFDTLVLRPFRTSRTYENLTARPYGVFHVVDDVLLWHGRPLEPCLKFPGISPRLRSKAGCSLRRAAGMNLRSLTSTTRKIE